MQKPIIKHRRSWHGPIAGYATNYINRNIWRVSRQHDFEDLLQDAYLKFLYLDRKYYKVTKPQHFMALYKTALTNHFHDLARRENLYHPQELLEDTTIPDNGIEEAIALAMVEAPDEVKSFISALYNDDFLEKLRNYAYKVIIDGELPKFRTTNDMLCELLGFDSKKVNVVKQLLDHLGVEDA